MAARSPSSRASLTPDERTRLAELYRSRGERATLAVLNISRSTLSRALAGQTIQQSTLFAIRARLRAA